jgi:hypothetical protein
MLQMDEKLVKSDVGMIDFNTHMVESNTMLVMAHENIMKSSVNTSIKSIV